MAVVLVIQDTPEGIVDLHALEDAGHLVRRCFGSASTFAACPMLRTGDCPLPAGAQVIVFAPGFLDAPVAHRSYRMVHVLRGYRRHPAYARLPVVLVADRIPEGLGGSGTIRLLPPSASASALHAAIEEAATGE